MSKRKIVSWGLVIAYYGLVTLVSNMSSPPSPFSFPNIDKLYHTLEYAALGLFLCFAYRGIPSLRSSKWPFAFALCTGALLGALDEWHQSFVPSREVSLLDWGADVFGTLCGIALYPAVRAGLMRWGGWGRAQQAAPLQNSGTM